MWGTDSTATEDFLAQRAQLIGVAHGIVGDLGADEDIVRNAGLRLGRRDEGIDDLTGWLVVVTPAGRRDLATGARRGSLRARRSRTHVGPWPPEPIVTGLRDEVDPAEQVTLAGIRQHRTAGGVADAAFPPTAPRFGCTTRPPLRQDRHSRGPRVLRGNGGGVVRASRRPILGADEVACFGVGVRARCFGVGVRARKPWRDHSAEVDGGADFLGFREDRLSLNTLVWNGNRIVAIDSVLPPDTLARTRAWSNERTHS